MSPLRTLVDPTTLPESGIKRRQIIDGARTIFLARGFDPASMGEIAKAAGVSKGTLYVYFRDKDELIQTIVEEECASQAENIFVFDLNDLDIEGVLVRVAVAFVQELCSPRHMPPMRAVIAVAGRTPSLGRRFYETGPAVGIARLRAYLEAQVVVGQLIIADYEVAAAQFIESCQATISKPMLFNVAPPASLERIEYVVTTTVKNFLTVYRKHC